MAEPLADPAERGALTLRHRAVERVAVAAALAADGVHRYGRGLSRWTGRELPRADVVVAGQHVHASVDIAVEWGRPLAATAADTARHITHALGAMSGLTVDAVDVHVAVVIPPGETPAPGRSLQ